MLYFIKEFLIRLSIIQLHEIKIGRFGEKFYPNICFDKNLFHIKGLDVPSKIKSTGSNLSLF